MQDRATGTAINRNQAIALAIAAANLLLVLLFPPFDQYSIANSRVPVFAGFNFAFAAPPSSQVNAGVLWLEVIVVLANAGIDQSNLETEDHDRRVLLLPEYPDASALHIKQRIDAHFQADIGVIITDSAGRAWRLGTVGLAIGAAGVPALQDRRGERDLSGRPLEATEVGFADGVAAAAVLVMGEAAEGWPAALVRGMTWRAPARPASALVRPKHEDLFR